MRLNVNPTRMELQRLRSRMRVAVKGHKLLKDKSDEMVRQFIQLSKLNTNYRQNVERGLTASLKSFITAGIQMHSQELHGALIFPLVDYELMLGTKNIMGLNVPQIEINNFKIKEITESNRHLCDAVNGVTSHFENILRLAEVEKTCDMLAAEIEKNRRRINSLEFILIPQIEETIKYIVMKLGENERQNTARLMKIKNKKS